MSQWLRDREKQQQAERLQDRADRQARKREIDAERRAMRGERGRSGFGGGWWLLLLLVVAWFAFRSGNSSDLDVTESGTIEAMSSTEQAGSGRSLDRDRPQA